MASRTLGLHYKSRVLAIETRNIGMSAESYLVVVDNGDTKWNTISQGDSMLCLNYTYRVNLSVMMGDQARISFSSELLVGLSNWRQLIGRKPRSTGGCLAVESLDQSEDTKSTRDVSDALMEEQKTRMGDAQFKRGKEKSAVSYCMSDGTPLCWWG